MSGFLAQVCAQARARVAEAVRDEPLEALRARALERPAPPGFAAALAGDGVAVIAEVKRASPSRGRLAAIGDPAALARRYAEGGAAAVSVLTEPTHFAGSLDDLATVAAAAPLPVLRKDFVVDRYQVLEARAAGAAAVLLIVAALPQPDLEGLLVAAAQAGLDALVEVHDPDEATRAALAHCGAATGWPLVIGVNARDLVTLSIDQDRFEVVRGALPEDAVTVAESGVRGPVDVRRLAGLGADAVLVGEHVATAADPAAAVRALVEAGTHEEASP
ncbi:MAG: indole-3-glycerol phosphate synthase TrpC [Egibacteraceae bacterium]